MKVQDIFTKGISQNSSSRKKLEKKLSTKKTFSSLLEEKTVSLTQLNSSSSEVPYLDYDELVSLLDDVHEEGEKLISEPSQVHVKAYRQKVQSFLQTVISEALDLKQEQGSVRQNYKRVQYTLVSVINQKLDRLVISFLENQMNQLQLLESLEEIQGLLVDLLS